jgi:predicted ATPase/DNA-binding winged helix-turn-helix (wHTH) protein
MPAESGELVLMADECEIDLAQRELRVLGSPVPVGARAFEIVELLARSAGELVTKDELMNRVWPGAIMNDNALQVHISAIRKALGSHRALLKTESGRGYRLLGTWTILGRSPPPAAPQQEPEFEKYPPTNLSEVTAGLIGRSSIVRRLRDLVSAYRALTLTGPGGIGKTMLALEVASGLLGEFDGGAWLVELASLSHPGLVPSAVASVLGLKFNGGEISAESVARAVGETNLLLILDNCEHVVDAAATLVETFLRLCPRTTILATSRELLRINGEYVYRVPPLDVPGAAENDTGHILASSAVELFIARAKALDSDFSPDAENVAAIASICRHLDGIPLAIEFAAARAAMLGVAQVSADLGDRFALLTRGRRTARPRHRTLRAVLEWSYELLPETERLLLCHLAIFPAGFTLDAATAVMNDSGTGATAVGATAVMDGIGNLVAKSLVMLDEPEAGTSWYLLETIRAYAREKLAESGAAGIAAQNHAAYFRQLFPGWEQGAVLQLPDAELARRVRHIDNVRAALDWAFSPSGDQRIGIDLTAAYVPVWLHLSLMGECRERCERALLGLEPEAAADQQLQMRLRIGLASALIMTLGPAEQTKTILAQALEAADILNDVDAQARVLSSLMTVYVYRGEYGKARLAVERLREIADRIGDPEIVRFADRLMGTTLLTIGRPREAQKYFESVLRPAAAPAVRRFAMSSHSNNIPMTRALLARALWLQGFPEKANDEARASLAELRGTDHQLLLCRAIYYGIGRLAPMIGDFAAADRAIARLTAIATSLNAPFWKTVGRFLEGKCLVERRAFAEGLVALQDAFETCDRTGWRMSYPEFKGSLAMALAGLGRLVEARGAVDDAIDGAGEGEDGQRWYVPELLRIKGEVLLSQAPNEYAAAAEDCFDQAGELAREQGALFWELRIAISLCRLRVMQGRGEAARQILAPVYERFTEGFGTADMRAAKVLLDSLAR